MKVRDLCGGLCRDHVGFWCSEMKGRGINPKPDSFDDLISRRGDISYDTARSIVSDLQIGGAFVQLCMPKARCGLTKEDTNLVTVAFLEQLLHELLTHG